MLKVEHIDNIKKSSKNIKLEGTLMDGIATATKVGKQYINNKINHDATLKITYSPVNKIILGDSVLEIKSKYISETFKSEKELHKYIKDWLQGEINYNNYTSTI